MLASEILIKARKMIRHKSRWTQGAYAKNKKGVVVLETNPEAVCFCLTGALNAAAMGYPSERYAAKEYMIQVAVERGCHGVVDYNDRPKRQHRHILSLLDAAISKALSSEVKS